MQAARQLQGVQREPSWQDFLFESKMAAKYYEIGDAQGKTISETGRGQGGSNCRVTAIAPGYVYPALRAVSSVLFYARLSA
jgi:hypothetical protein